MVLMAVLVAAPRVLSPVPSHPVPSLIGQPGVWSSSLFMRESMFCFIGKASPLTQPKPHKAIVEKDGYRANGEKGLKSQNME